MTLLRKYRKLKVFLYRKICTEFFWFLYRKYRFFEKIWEVNVEKNLCVKLQIFVNIDFSFFVYKKAQKYKGVCKGLCLAEFQIFYMWDIWKKFSVQENFFSFWSIKMLYFFPFFVQKNLLFNFQTYSLCTERIHQKDETLA